MQPAHLLVFPGGERKSTESGRHPLHCRCIHSNFSPPTPRGKWMSADPIPPESSKLNFVIRCCRRMQGEPRWLLYLASSTPLSPTTSACGSHQSSTRCAPRKCVICENFCLFSHLDDVYQLYALKFYLDVISTMVIAKRRTRTFFPI